MLNSVQKLKAAPRALMSDGHPIWRQDYFSFYNLLLILKFLATFLPFIVEYLV